MLVFSGYLASAQYNCLPLVMQIKIRQATSADMKAVHQLVHELALYERLPNEVITSPEIFERDLNTHAFEAFVAEDLDLSENNIIGMALYYNAYSTWKGKYLWLEDFVVKESYRGKGIGTLLFNEIIALAKKQNTLLKWQVLDWNAPAIAFYKKYEAEFQDGWITCRKSFIS